MQVICNTTPFIALSSTDSLHLLRDIYESVLVPDAVYEEINLGGMIEVPELKSLDWIKRIPNITSYENELLFQLDYGVIRD